MTSKILHKIYIDFYVNFTQDFLTLILFAREKNAVIIKHFEWQSYERA